MLRLDRDSVQLRPQSTSGSDQPMTAAASSANASAAPAQVCFNRQELSIIFDVYGRKVAAGEWRDYALDMGRDKAVFSVYRRSSEYPLYRIEKAPRLARNQGACSVITPTGLILKRGGDLRAVLAVLDGRLRAV